MIAFNPSTILLKFLAESTINLLQPLADKKSISLIDNITDGVNIFADSNMILTIFRNLITNAIKFTPTSGKITLDVKIEHNYCFISIADTGVGMNEETIEKLFRIDTKVSELGTEKEKGTGLGLILCKEFVEKHGGKIWVESRKGEGSTFIFTMPVTANIQAL